MTLLAGRMPSLHQHSHYGEDTDYCSKETQGILKSGSAWRHRPEDESYFIRRQENNQRNDEGKRLVRFSEAEEERQPRTERNSAKVESQDVIKFGNNTYVINSSDPNSAVRKLFPNSNLTPINPFVSKCNARDRTVNGSQNNSLVENNRDFYGRTKLQNNNCGKAQTLKKTNGTVARRNLRKVPPETKPKPGKGNDASTPLIERIKLLTCENGETAAVSTLDSSQPSSKKGFDLLETNSSPSCQEYNKFSYLYKSQEISDSPKQAKEGLNLMRYNQNISQPRPQPTFGMTHVSPHKVSPTEEARRSFLYSLSRPTESKPGNRESIASNSTTADTVYSLSDIEEALTEEEKEIKDAFSQENKQDELELFVQQDAGRTERLRKRYSSTPKPENQAVVGRNFTSSTSNLNFPYFTVNSPGIKKEKPKFGSTMEILQQLQHQIETPYQLEGRRTACSNYSDSSIPISDRLFGDESSDGYEPVIPKLNVHRTCSLDSKNYEEIDNFASAFCVPRAKSHEYPNLSHLESDPYIYPHSVPRHPGNFVGKNQPFDQTIYASSPDLHGYQYALFPDRVSSYNSNPVNNRPLHPVLQKQYCRYPVNNTMFPNPAEEGKVLTPPSRMHTYMNIPPNAPCYISPPPYSKTNQYSKPPVQSDMNNYSDASIYQNISASINPSLMTLRRICTEKERGVPEGASSTQDSKEMFPPPSKEYYSSPNLLAVSRLPSVPHHYCVDV